MYSSGATPSVLPLDLVFFISSTLVFFMSEQNIINYTILHKL